MDLAFRMLARRARSEGEVARALAERGAGKTVVRGVLGRLRALGYIDDRKFAAECAERWKERGFGSLRILDQLRRLRVEEGVAERVTPGAREERDLARRVLARHFGTGGVADRRGMARAARFLAGRGFAAEVIDSLFDPWE
ncbi:MAG: RecX family transcriptional regulator [Deltaproteobacteria bacterium]|nr:RecX family transcriptional regulator [Deltaproteobacteria bacterium]